MSLLLDQPESCIGENRHQNENVKCEDTAGVPVKPGEVGFCILENGTLCGRRKLIDTRGYTYNIRHIKDSRTYWWCSVRNKTVHCKATVIQMGEIFKFGSKEHCHEPKPVSQDKKKRKHALHCATVKKVKKEKCMVAEPSHCIETSEVNEDKSCLGIVDSDTSSEDSDTDRKNCLELAERAGSSVCHQSSRTEIQGENIKKEKQFAEDSLDIRFRIIDEGTRCGRRMLVDNHGYTYNVKCHKNNVTYWWCAVRNKTVHCRAAVSQRGEKFKIGKAEHCHEAVFKPKKKHAVSEDLTKSSASGIDEMAEFEIPGESLSFQILKNFCKYKYVILADSDGYYYRMKRQNGDQTYWICIVQNKNHRCSATVSQKGDKFRLGKMEHCHKPSSTLAKSQKIASKQSEPSSTFHKVVAECLDLEELEEDNEDEPHHIQSYDEHPIEQSRRKAEVNTKYIPKPFLLKDIRIDGSEQHLLLAFKEQMKLLSEAQIWYLDTATRVVCEPFVQLLTIHTCVQLAGEIGHVPLIFILMTRCQREDYIKVFQVILDEMPHPVAVNTFVASVDNELWEAVRNTFPNRILQGCAFHWGKAVWQKAEELGLKTDYENRDTNFEFINKVLALPFLPHEHIGLAFRSLWDSAREFSRLKALTDFIDVTLVSSSSWDISSWSIFMQSIRTRDDVEGWHRNMRLGCEKPSFYRLIWELLQEAKLIPLQVTTVCDEKLSSYQKRNMGSLQNDVFDLWSSYNTGNLSTDVFLEKIGLLYCFEITIS